MEATCKKMVETDVRLIRRWMNMTRYISSNQACLKSIDTIALSSFGLFSFTSKVYLKFLLPLSEVGNESLGY